MKKAIVFSAIVMILIGFYAIAADDYFPDDEYVEADLIEVHDITITIAGGCKAIIADTSPERALAIEYGLEGTIEERPTVYDTFSSVLDTFNITLVSMAIESRDDIYFYSSVVFRNPTKVLKLDLKPSDAMALALRTGAPIYISKTLLEEDGIDIC